mmetsp:Transcript_21297/g.49421  ORF Transcript_21297/g.49421 Transcript_21297/m.49421 type:complete len:205 (+) Transcript_21297:564-1178(+)
MACKYIRPSSSTESNCPTGCFINARTGAMSRSGPSARRNSCNSSSCCISWNFNSKDLSKWRGRFCTVSAVTPRATDCAKSTHHLSSPSFTLSDVKTTCPSVTAFTSSRKSSKMPEPSLSSPSSASCCSTLAFARDFVASSTAMASIPASFLSKSARDAVDTSRTRLKASNVREPPPLASAILLARCKNRPKNVRRIPCMAVFCS